MTGVWHVYVLIFAFIAATAFFTPGSAQFSAVVTEVAAEDAVGTALTFQTASASCSRR